MIRLTYRPIGARIISYVVAGCFLLIFGVITFRLPGEVRDSISAAQLVTLLLLFGVSADGAGGVLHRSEARRTG